MAPKHLQRLQQTLGHLSGGARTSDAPQETQLSIVHGPSEPPLSSETLGTLLERQVEVFGDRCAVRCSWTGQQLTYKELHSHSRALAAGLLSLGLTRGDHIAIMAGNCEQYVEVIFAAGLVGMPLVVLNTNYTNDEVENAVHRAGVSPSPRITAYTYTSWPHRMPVALHNSVYRLKKHGTYYQEHARQASFVLY